LSKDIVGTANVLQVKKSGAWRKPLPHQGRYFIDHNAYGLAIRMLRFIEPFNSDLTAPSVK